MIKAPSQEKDSYTGSPINFPWDQDRGLPINQDNSVSKSRNDMGVGGQLRIKLNPRCTDSRSGPGSLT